MSPIDVVNPNRILLAPITTRKGNTIQTVKEKSSMAGDYDKKEEESSIETLSSNKARTKDNNEKHYKREAKSACELRRKPW